MQAQTIDMAHLEQYINSLDNPDQVRRMRAWMERLLQLRCHPECRTLADITEHAHRKVANG